MAWPEGWRRSAAISGWAGCGSGYLVLAAGVSLALVGWM